MTGGTVLSVDGHGCRGSEGVVTGVNISTVCEILHSRLVAKHVCGDACARGVVTIRLAVLVRRLASCCAVEAQYPLETTVQRILEQPSAQARSVADYGRCLCGERVFAGLLSLTPRRPFPAKTERSPLPPALNPRRRHHHINTPYHYTDLRRFISIFL